MVLELRFRHEHQWAAFRALPGVGAALDAVPDRDALFIYRGRGGSAGRPTPRSPRPLRGSGAMALPEPVEDERSRILAPLGTSGLCTAGGVPLSPSR